MSYDMKVNIDAVSKASDEVIARALEVIGGMAESNAKRLCPVDTGNLRNSITHQADGPRRMAVGTNVVYAPFVELGTYKTKAQPYLRPAVEGHVREYREVLEREAKKG